MDRSGAQIAHQPHSQLSFGRSLVDGAYTMKGYCSIQDRHERDFCFGPTHEEVITDIARQVLKAISSCLLTITKFKRSFEMRRDRVLAC